MKKIAIMYDFDKTLSTKYMQEFTLLPSFGIGGKEFFEEKNILQKENNMDGVIAYSYLLLQKAKEKNIKITRKLLSDAGRDIEFYPGVFEWFERINKYGREYGIEVEHYIISSGNKEMIEGTPIAKFFKMIYASEFHYDKDGFADWLSVVVNYTNKTQFIYRINKGTLDVYDDDGVNNYMPHEVRPIPRTNMIFIGDGITDVPCMKTVKAKGGYSVAVYEESRKYDADELLNQNRITFSAVADYRENSELDKQVKKIIEEISHNYT